MLSGVEAYVCRYIQVVPSSIANYHSILSNIAKYANYHQLLLSIIKYHQASTTKHHQVLPNVTKYSEVLQSVAKNRVLYPQG